MIVVVMIRGRMLPTLRLCVACASTVPMVLCWCCCYCGGGVVQEYLLEAVPAYTLLLEAHSACKDYASNTSRALLKARAPALFDR